MCLLFLGVLIQLISRESIDISSWLFHVITENWCLSWRSWNVWVCPFILPGCWLLSPFSLGLANPVELLMWQCIGCGIPWLKCWVPQVCQLIICWSGRKKQTGDSQQWCSLNFLFVYHKCQSAALPVREFEVHLLDVDMWSLLLYMPGVALAKPKILISQCLILFNIFYILLQIEMQVQSFAI